MKEGGKGKIKCRKFHATINGEKTWNAAKARTSIRGRNVDNTKFHGHRKLPQGPYHFILATID